MTHKTESILQSEVAFSCCFIWAVSVLCAGNAPWVPRVLDALGFLRFWSALKKFDVDQENI